MYNTLATTNTRLSYSQLNSTLDKTLGRQPTKLLGGPLGNRQPAKQKNKQTTADYIRAIADYLVANPLVISRKDGLFKIFLGVVCPKLRYLWVGLDRHVPVTAIGPFFYPTDINVIDRVAIVVKAHWVAQW